MRAGIRSFLVKYSYSSASTKDLWNSFETENDLNVVEMMETWTKQKGFPVISVMINLIKYFSIFFQLFFQLFFNFFINSDNRESRRRESRFNFDTRKIFS
jgi:aminopeptidase N